MDRWFTPQERGVILFLIATLLLGTVIYIYKSKTTYFAPELKILKDEEWVELENYDEEMQLNQLIQKTDSSDLSEVGVGGKRVGLEAKRGRQGFNALPKIVEQGLPGIHDRVNINTATEQELIALPGIGPVLAKRIIEYRERSGGFKKIEDIIKVRGIGQKKFETLKDKITI